MRLCRFSLDDIVLTGFYHDDQIIPIDHAAEAFGEEHGVELDLPESGNLLSLLVEESTASAVRTLSDWIDGLGAEARDALVVATADVRLLIPIDPPGKILLLAGNYADHIAERGGTSVERAETFPYVFSKPTTTLTHPGDPVVLPRISPDRIDWECELGVVIGRTCRDVDESEALRYVAGYTVVNDISDRQFRPNPGRKPRDRDRFFDWLHGKWHDTFCPVGPCILAADRVPDPQAMAIELTLNGEVKQSGNTGQMIFPVAAIVSFVSRFVRLEPGDLISTGTPSGVGSARDTYLRGGDVLRARIEGIGTLENPVVAQGA